jgi:hypothetical protein
MNTILAPRTRDSPGNWHLSPKIVDEHRSTQRAHGGRRNRYTAFVDYPTRYAAAFGRGYSCRERDQDSEHCP